MYTVRPGKPTLDDVFSLPALALEIVEPVCWMRLALVLVLRNERIGIIALIKVA